MMTDESTTQCTGTAQQEFPVDDLASDVLEAITGGGPAQNGFAKPD